MNHLKSDEEFLELLSNAGNRVLPLLRTPVSKERAENLFKRLDQETPFLRELAPADMEILVLRILSKWPSDAHDLIAKLNQIRCTVKSQGRGVIYGLLRRMVEAGLLRYDFKTIDGRPIRFYRPTEEGHDRLAGAKSESWEQIGWLERASRMAES